MINELKFVAGAINRKDIVAALSHFRIKDGVVKGFNGVVGLCSPIDLDLDVTPKAESFIKAIQNCEETIQIHLTAGGKLSIRSGTFKALVECLDNTEYPEILPEGEYLKMEEPILEKLKTLVEFVSDDASRPWSRGILFHGNYLYATNNIILARCKLNSFLPITVNIPKIAIDQLIRIGKEPEYIQYSKNRVAFYYEQHKWLTCQTYSADWPRVEAFFTDEERHFIEVDSSLIKDLEKLKPFMDEFNRVIFSKGLIKTHESDDTGASIINNSVTWNAIFNNLLLLDVLNVANRVDFSLYPKACPFENIEQKLEGVIMGIKA